jgi:putative phosphoesterase
MILGVISDTHGMLRPGVEEVFRGVDRIVHCGDVGPPHILDQLALIAPVSAAYGNTDGFDTRSRSSKVVRVDCAGRVTVALHGDQFGMPTPSVLRSEFSDADIILFGHTHKPLIDQPSGKATVLNPGAAGAVRCSCRPSVAVIELVDGIAPVARIVELDAAG